MFFPRCNLHTHTLFCNGKDSPEEVVLHAIGNRMTTIGFSVYSPAGVVPGTMSAADEPAYLMEIERLKKQYADQIRVVCGLEQDFYSSNTESQREYEYIIGSVHSLYVGGAYHMVDECVKEVQASVRSDFGGDIYRYIKCYYETVVQLPKKTGCDIIGHFDLVEKFNEEEKFFSRSDIRYRRAALDALDALLEENVIFEINTGAMATGYRKLPYPNAFLLRRIAEKRGRVILSSDAHRKEDLMFGFPEATAFAHACGIGGLTVYTEKGFETIPIKI